MNGGAWDETARDDGASGSGLIGLLAPRVQAGQLVFANAMRRAIYAVAPDVFNCLDFGNDEAFLEPMAIAELRTQTDAAGERTADLLTALGCYVDMPLHSAKIPIIGDRFGRTFISGHGFVSTRGHSSFTPINDMEVGGRGLLLLPYPVATFERAIFGEENYLLGVESAARQHRVTLDGALRSLEIIWPELMRLITETVRYLLLFEQPTQNSFASKATHGVAYLNVALGHSGAFFMEDLAHQCGHVLFSSAWEGGDGLLRTDGDEPMADVTGQDGDDRTLEVAVHGIVTLALMLAALDRYLDWHASEGDSAEAKARLLFALYRLGLDIGPLARSTVFSTEGTRVFGAVAQVYDRMLARYRGELAASDLTGQGYNFDYDIFRRRNSTWTQCAVAKLDTSHA